MQRAKRIEPAQTAALAAALVEVARDDGTVPWAQLYHDVYSCRTPALAALRELVPDKHSAKPGNDKHLRKLATRYGLMAKAWHGRLVLTAKAKELARR